MKRAAIILTAACLLPFARAGEPPESDLLRFLNGDQLHGRFDGIQDKQSVSWRRADAANPVEFQSAQLRQIVFHGGKAVRPLHSASHISLANGDEIPGDVISLDDRTAVIATEFAGRLSIAREHIVALSPAPYGGKLLYHGPFSDDGWDIIRPQGKPAKSEPEAESNPDASKAEHDPLGDDASSPAWSFSGAAWYERGKHAALARRDIMPDRASLRFHLAWKSRLMLAVAFHADMSRPPPVSGKFGSSFPDAGGITNYPRVFGNSYVIQILANYVMLYRCALDANGHTSLERIQANASNVRMPDNGEANIELRCDRNTGGICLFIDDQFAMQWNEPSGPNYAGHGKSFAFQVPGEAAPVRISDILVAEWNGMPDSARSMKSADADILLLANGTERFSGEDSTIHDGTVTLRGKYGTYQIPLAECAELHLASKHVTPPPEAPKDSVRILFQPVGRITGTLMPSAAGTVTLASGLAGTLSISCESANLLQFQPTEQFLDDWDPAF